jgi:stage V sporulation protein S
MKTLKVAASSKATSLAGAIAWAVRQQEDVQLVAIGAAAVNQATKAVAIARTYLALEGVDLSLTPAFATVETPNEDERTALVLGVVPRPAAVVVGPVESLEAGASAPARD